MDNPTVTNLATSERIAAGDSPDKTAHGHLRNQRNVQITSALLLFPWEGAVF